MAAGKEDGDEDTQIQAVENAISKGDAGILITPNGPPSRTRWSRHATPGSS
jgi:fructose transport system substrate-binding protein